MLRAFLAIDVPGSLQPRLSRVQEELKQSGAEVRWVPVGNIHLTLKFFGQISEAQVEDIAQAAGHIAREQAPFRLQITQAGWKRPSPDWGFPPRTGSSPRTSPWAG